MDVLLKQAENGQKFESPDMLLSVCDGILKINPYHARAILLKAIAYKRKGEFDEFKFNLLKSYKIDGFDPDVIPLMREIYPSDH